MTTQTERNYQKREAFNEVFWAHEQEPLIEGIFQGFVTKVLDKDERTFAVVSIEAKEKPYLCGGRDLLNKLNEQDKGHYVRIKFLGKETFTPKGTKKKVPINRFSVEVGELA